MKKISFTETRVFSENQLPHAQVKSIFVFTDSTREKLRVVSRVSVRDHKYPTAKVKVFFEEDFDMDDVESMCSPYGFFASMFISVKLMGLKYSDEFLDMSEGYKTEEILDVVDRMFEITLTDHIKTAIKQKDLYENT